MKVWKPLVKANHVNPVSCFLSFLASRGDHMSQFQPKQKSAGGEGGRKVLREHLLS